MNSWTVMGEGARVLGAKLRLIAVLLVVSMIGSAPALAEPLGVLVNSSVTTKMLSRVDLRLLFSGRTQYWPDGTPVVVLVLPASDPLHQAFCRDYLRLYPYQLERIWQRVTYSGQGNAPRVANSAAELMQLLATTPGAIGYGSHATLNDQIHSIPVTEE